MVFGRVESILVLRGTKAVVEGRYEAHNIAQQEWDFHQYARLVQEV